jgi:hypothetical protein
VLRWCGGHWQSLLGGGDGGGVNQGGIVECGYSGGG